jgi:D-alanine-D-alanine ligase-like ATP-grasp enzyme
MPEKWPSKIIILHPKLDKEKSESATPKEILLANEYGRNDDVLDLKQHLEAINHSTDIEIILISLKNFKKILKDISERYSENVVALNLCDGTEQDGYPGLSVVKELEMLRIPFTGARSDFFDITTSKPRLKELLIEANVPTSQFVEVDPDNVLGSIQKAVALLKWPLIVKPSVSYASIAITTKSVVENENDALKQITHVLQTTSDGVFLESFLAGREFTALCTGTAPNVKVHIVAERVFNPKLKEKERILAFDKCNLICYI